MKIRSITKQPITLVKKNKNKYMNWEIGQKLFYTIYTKRHLKTYEMCKEYLRSWETIKFYKSKRKNGTIQPSISTTLRKSIIGKRNTYQIIMIAYIRATYGLLLRTGPWALKIH